MTFLLSLLAYVGIEVILTVIVVAVYWHRRHHFNQILRYKVQKYLGVDVIARTVNTISEKQTKLTELVVQDYLGEKNPEFDEWASLNPPKKTDVKQLRSRITKSRSKNGSRP